MSSGTELSLAGLAGNQWGMFTAAQAVANGVARSTILRREQSGTLVRVRPGVYRLPGAPVNRLDDVRAIWLSTTPATPAWERQLSPDVVVGGAAAAWAHDLGDLYPNPVLLYSTARRQTKHADLRYTMRQLPAQDITSLDGLPVTTRERTIADLFDEPGADLSVIADALRDAVLGGPELDEDRLSTLLDSRAARLGYESGATLYKHLRSSSAVDEDRLRELLARPDLQDLIDAVARARDGRSAASTLLLDERSVLAYLANQGREA